MNRASLISALLGGAIVAVVVVALGGVTRDKKTTTVIRQAPVAAMAGKSAAGLTARDIYKRDAPGVVFIRAQVVSKTPSIFGLFGPPVQRGQEVSGSGIVLDKKGYILTNAHVVEGGMSITVAFEDKQRIPAKVVGRDPSTDLAVLQIKPPAGIKLAPLELGTSSNVQVGDPTIAIGNPFGLDRTLTTGVVSALQRRIDAPNGFSIDHVIQTDAPINPGNSGGPLIDASGRVIGINSQIETGGAGQGSIGIGFAVPIDTARQELAKLEKGGTIQRAYLGISGASIDASLSSLKLPVSSGALVSSVLKGGPADKAGVKGGQTKPPPGSPRGLPPTGGDIIQSIDGKSVKSFDDVTNIVNQRKPGDTVKLGLLRGKNHLTVTVKLGVRPNKAPK
ncbi:MAG TPA: trypsin-like peptidase domain-containing protein [Solirubrobacteraceae bacterium]|nr:trypsin-like peptidase domain-containing protein [Solirubrobacteraceae bacterium]